MAAYRDLFTIERMFVYKILFSREIVIECRKSSKTDTQF